MKRVLLSASHPYGERAKAVRPYSHEEIDLAASAVVESVLQRSDIILRFGAHPSITPLVLSIANSVTGNPEGGIELVYSEFFAEKYTDAMRRLAESEGVNAYETSATHDPDPGVARRASLTTMRSELTKPPLDAVFFIGGMNGIVDEFVEAARQHPSAQFFAFTAPGGQAARLAQTTVGAGRGPHVREISSRGYLISAQDAIAEIVSS